MNFINFFREDLSEILGIYYDSEKIFLARFSDKLEMDEINFEITNDAPVILQLAQKIKFICNKNFWQNPKISLILREGTAATFQSDFKNIPAAEIENAVKIWATAHVGKEARYTFIKSNEEIWMEALPASIVEEYVDAFAENSLTLCNITEFPTIFADSDRPPTPYNLAIFAADIMKYKKPPNILPSEISTWNFKKIACVAAAVFLIVLAVISAKIGHDFYTAENRLKTAQNRFTANDDLYILKSTLDASTAKIKQFDGVISAQNVNHEKFNALLKIGKLSDGKIILDKIKANDETLELEGVAETPDAVKLYLNRLKNFISSKVKLKNSTEEDGQFVFSISIIFS